MIIFFILIAVPLISTFLYVYLNQVINGIFIWWTIPVGLISVLLGMILLLVLFLLSLPLFYKPKSFEENQIKQRPYLAFLINQVGFVLTVILRVKIVFEGKNKLPKNGPFLLVSNHQSNYDAIGLEMNLSKYRPFYLFKNNLLKVPLVGKTLIIAGHLPLNRANARKGLETISFAVKRIEKGESLCIYPEGTRSLERKLGELHAATFKIALKAKCPIVILPSDGAGLLHKNYPFKKTTVVYRVARVLTYEEIKNLSTSEIKEIVVKEFNENIDDFREKYPFLKAGL